LERENEVSVDPGEFFSLSPQIFFVVNPYINLNGGLRLSVQEENEIDGERTSLLRTSVSPIFGVSYEVSDSSILSLDTEYISEGSFSQAIASLRFTYRF
jgi:hypothetical protein